MKSCCFTGHRQLGGKEQAIFERLCFQIECCVSAGIEEFRCGGALGFDTVAALAVLKMKEQFQQIRLVLYIPCADQDKRWSAAEQKRYREIWKRADTVHVLAERYYDGCMFVRNRSMVDGSELCIAYLKRPSGGTKMTVNYAKKQQVTVINLGDLI